MQSAVAASLSEHWRLFLFEGIVLLLLGFAAIAIPPLATFAVEILIGWLLLASGIVFSDWDLRDALRTARTAAGTRPVIDSLSIEEGGR